ncbi:MAG: hypothetical protein WKF79_00380 [Nocardioides sp.]
MVDFSHLAKLDVNAASEAEFFFEDIPGEPSVWFKPMTDANPDYLNERVRLAVERAEHSNKETKAQRRKRVLSADQLEEDRELDRVLLARTCALRWGTAPKDAKGKEPPFNEQNCYDFFKALPSYMFDPCRGFVSNVYNFVDRASLAGSTGDETLDGGEGLGNS